MKIRFKHFFCALATVAVVLCGFSALSSLNLGGNPIQPVYAARDEEAIAAMTTRINKLNEYYTKNNKTLDSEHKKDAQKIWEDYEKMPKTQQDALHYGAGKSAFDILDGIYKKSDYDKGIANMTNKEKETEKEMTEEGQKNISKKDSDAAADEIRKENNEDSSNWGWKAKTAESLFDEKTHVTLFGIEIHFMDLTDATRKLLLFNGSGVDEADNKGILSLSNGKSGNDRVTLWSIAEKINGGLASLSAFLLVAMFFMELFETTLREAERISWERVMMIFIKLYFWRTIASESFELMKAILNSGDWVFGVISKYAKINTIEKASIGKTIGTMIHSQGNIQALISLLFVFIFWTLILGSCIAVLVQVFARAFKIIIYAAFAPLPIALCANEHTANTGKRFIMNFFATALEAGIILMLTYIYAIGMSALQTDLIKNSTSWGSELGTMANALVGIFILNAIYAAVISASTQISREVIGI